MSTWVLICYLMSNAAGAIAIPGYETKEDCELAFLEAKREYLLGTHACIRGPRQELEGENIP